MGYRIEKALRREKKYNKKRYGMRVSNKSIFVIVETTVTRAEKNKKNKKNKKKK